MRHTKDKIFIIPYLHNPCEVYSNVKPPSIIQDVIINEDVRIFQTEIESTKFWSRRVIASNQVDFTSRKFFMKLNISYALGLIQRPVYCKIITQNNNDCNSEISVRVTKLQNTTVQQKTTNFVDLEKILLLNHDESLSFDDNDFSNDSKVTITIELDSGQSKTKQDFIIFAKSLIEIHEKLFLEINELPNWNKIRYRVFENIRDRFLIPILNKGMKEPHYKDLIENNYGHFEEFFRKKVHQIINDLLSKKDNYKKLLLKNRDLLLTIEKEFKPQIIAQQSAKNIELLVKIINKKIDYSNLSLLSETLSEIILSSIPINEQLLKSFNELIYYLIVF